MSWLDAAILLPLLVGLVRGLMKGFIREVMSVVAIILGFLGARWWGKGTALWLHNQWQWPEAVCAAISYVLIFIAIAVVLSIIARLLSRLFRAINLGGFNRLLGALFGIAKWSVLVIVLVFVTDMLNAEFGILPPEVTASSKLYPIVLDWARQLWAVSVGTVQAV